MSHITRQDVLDSMRETFEVVREDATEDEIH